MYQKIIVSKPLGHKLSPLTGKLFSDDNESQQSLIQTALLQAQRACTSPRSCSPVLFYFLKKNIWPHLEVCGTSSSSLTRDRDLRPCMESGFLATALSVKSLMGSHTPIGLCAYTLLVLGRLTDGDRHLCFAVCCSLHICPALVFDPDLAGSRTTCVTYHPTTCHPELIPSSD